MTRQTADAEATEALGAELAERLAPGDLVLVAGDVGAGKTTLIRGACRALGVRGPVTSPTFTIGRRYEGRHPIAHLDLYRLVETGLGVEEPGLVDDYLTADAIGFVEWPLTEAGEPVLEAERTAAAWLVTLHHDGGDRRAIEIVAPVVPRAPEARSG